jgi:threo-3-hydroxy-L-aspartate ammonia-lyase
MTTNTPPATTAILLTLDDIVRAHERIAPWVHRTPVLTSRTLDDRCNASVFLKCENFQRVGAFKFRGALNAILQLDEPERKAGVVTHSSGNHAQAVALAGQLLNVPVTVVMPSSAPAVKRAATEGYGARIVTCEPTQAAREAAVASEISRNHSTLVHPFDDWNVIAGQATAAWELLEQVPDLDIVICPVGGGGLLSGTALAVKGRHPLMKVFGAEPANADDARRSLESGKIEPSNDPKTVADGLRTSLGHRTFTVISKLVDGILTATEAEILLATRFVMERLKILIEPSSAVPIAPILCSHFDITGLRVAVIVSGGNVDVESLFQSLSDRYL